MIRRLFGKVMWLGRATSALVGLAVLLALGVGAANSALAHTTVDNKLFHLGHSNRVGTATTPGAPTALVATLSDAVKSALVVTNKSGGPALSLGVVQDQAPLKVNAEAGTATNLSADELDGRDSAAYQKRVSSCPLGSSIRSVGDEGQVICETDDTGEAQVNQLKSDLSTNDGTPNESTDLVSFNEVKDVPADVVNRNADKLDGQDASAFASAGSAPLWAVVEGNGDIVQSKGVVSVLRIHVGYYKVVFNRDVDQCAYSAMPVWTVGPLYGFGVTVSPRDGSGGNETPDTLYVNPYDDSGTQTDQRFHLIVYC